MNEISWLIPAALLLLALGGVLGWRWARSSDRLHQHYFKGLNYLLNEEPDKAIQVFLKLAEIDQNTFEAHLALGNLFRRRGEVDRAIRLHQNLLEEPGLDRAQEGRALQELGEDFLKAGLLDRAEDVFRRAWDKGLDSPVILKQLLAVYQQERDWNKAMKVAERLAQVTGESTAHMMAHFHCELANQARARGDMTGAGQHLRLARQQDPGSARALWLEGRIAAAAGDCDQAFERFQQAVDTNPDLLPGLLPDLTRVARQTGCTRRLDEVLNGWVDRQLGASAALALAEQIDQREGSEAAGDFLAGNLKRQPNLRTLKAYLDQRGGDFDDDIVAVLRRLANQLLRNRSVYRCRQCGLSGHSFHWHCPGCKHWNTTEAVRGIAGE